MTTTDQDGSASQHYVAEKTSDASNGQMHDTEVLQKRLLGVALNALTASQNCIPEVEEFIEKLTAKDRKISNTGLISFIRHLKQNEAILKEIAHDLSMSQTQYDTLRLLNRKLDICAVNASHGSLHWNVLKRCRSFVAVNQVFQGSDSEMRKKELSKTSLTGRDKELAHRTMKAQAKIEVHVVDGGAEWVIVQTIQPDRLARQMTDNGWGWGEYELGDVVDEQEWEDTTLAKQTRRFVVAARKNRHDYRIPRLRIVMPNIGSDNCDINVFLAQLSRIDPGVRLIIEGRDSDFLQRPPPKAATAIENLMGDELDGLTETLNLDHTILIDLISDIMHLRLEPQPWQESSTRAQIQQEKEHDGLMAKTLYPVLEGRRLVCTAEAAEHFHEVLTTVGTDSEKERGQLIVPFGETYRHMSHAATRARFEQLSVHPLPSTVQLPIHVLDELWNPEAVKHAVESRRLPEMAVDLARHSGFRSSKLSIFMYGWASGNVTLTSNKEIKGIMRTMVETHRREDDDYGPAIWRLDVTRNLLAKGAAPRDGYERHDVDRGS